MLNVGDADTIPVDTSIRSYRGILGGNFGGFGELLWIV